MFTITPKCTANISFEILLQASGKKQGLFSPELKGINYAVVIPVAASVQISTRLDADELILGLERNFFL